MNFSTGYHLQMGATPSDNMTQINNNVAYPSTETGLQTHDTTETPLTYGDYKTSLKRKYMDSFRTPKKQEPVAEYDEKGNMAMFTGRHPSYPDELNALIHPSSCDLCNMKMNSVISAKDHYESKSHDKSITNWITKNYTEKGINPPEIARFYKQGPVGPNAFHCELCDLKLTSVTHAQQHFAGKKHQMVLSQRSKPSGAGYYNNEGKWVRVSTKAFPKSADRRFGIGDQFLFGSSDNVSTTTADESSNSVVSSPQQMPEDNTDAKPPKIAKINEQDPNLFCVVCNVSATSALQMAMHLSGIKHQKKLKASGVEITITGHAPTSTTTDDTSQTIAVSLKDNVLNSVINEQKPDTIDMSMYRTPSGQYYCQTCNLTITNLHSLEQHLKGKRHLKSQMEQKAIAAIANVKRK
ncbi:zinc finger matrin-type protein 3-like [Musca vetustissima]|uniref:zinc finger matrin-type protein 3-like n=1 Tax=Musca vetustissima TaxID=27455 RepID=UPI002AB5E909|nr:zinc finger matrin-type protein 3-like [Musca vetustissima]